MQFVNAFFAKLTDKLPPFDERAVLFAFIAGLITGWIWYAVAGRIWKSSVVTAEKIYSPRRQIFSAIAQIVMTIMLAMSMHRLGETTVVGGVHTAFTLWLGFVITTMLVNYANLGQRLTLTLIDGVHWLLVLVVMGIVIGAVSGGSTVATPGAQPAAPAVSEPAAGSSSGG